MSRVWIVDACVAAKWWLSDEEFTEEALVVLRAVQNKEIQVAVPDLWLYELTNVIVLAARHGRITKEQAELFVKEVCRVPVSMYSLRAYLSWIADMASHHGLSAYDAAYVVLPEHLGCSFLTADDSMFNKVREQKPFIHHIREAKQLLATA